MIQVRASPSESSSIMSNESTSQRRTFTNPLAGVALGDPFVLRHRGEFYLYGTNDGAPLPMAAWSPFSVPAT